MAYTPNNLSAVTQTIEGGFNLFFYTATDSIAAVIAANYFTDGQKRGMEPGDFIIYYNSSTNVETLLSVNAVQAVASGFGATASVIGAGTGTGVPSVSTTINATGATTLTAAALVGGNILRTGLTAAATDTTDTAANIIAAMNSQTIGNSWHVLIANNTAFAETIAGGTGVTITGATVLAPNSWAEYLVTYSAANTITMQTLEAGQNAGVPPSQYKTAALQSAAIVAANMAGAAWCNFDNTGVTPGTLTTDTAANIIAAIPGAQVGFNYMLAIRNDSSGANTATIAGGTGVTVTGTATIAQNVTRLFNVSVTGAAAVTLQSMGVLAAAA